MKKLLIILLSSGLLVATGCNLQPNSTDQLNVVATFYPLAYFAERIGGDNVAVTTIIPNGIEPHDFAPTPQDIVKITNAAVLIYNGAGLDTWAENIPSQDYTQTEVFQIKAAAVGTADDPHVWLDPVLMQTIVEDIRNAYSELDPTHAADYKLNTEQLLASLQQLDEDYQTGLADCEIRQAIVAHDAFNYVANRYQLTILPIVGMNPNEAPSAQQIVELSEAAHTYGIEYIFFEELTSPKLSEVLAAEVGATTMVLSPVEGLSPEEQAAGDDYFSVMERNLDNLALALRCQ